MKVSVVISAYNEESKIEDCLKSVKKIASEIIFIDNSSIDKTVDIAKKYTDKIYHRENNPMLNVNKNFGFIKANSEWILNLDADERVTDELSDEILRLSDGGEVSGYYIPRKNIIFGKWIKNTGWYPDFQLRLFKKEHGKFDEKHVHEMLNIQGKTSNLNSNLLHLNYDSVTQFLNKMISIYTVSEAKNIINSGYKYDSLDIIKMPLSEFIKRFFAQNGYKDGMHGLVLSLLQAFYHFVVFLRIWENNKYPDENNNDKILTEARAMAKHEFRYWTIQKKLNDEKNIIKRQLIKIHNKVKI